MVLSRDRVDELVQIDRGRLDISIYTDPQIFDEEMQRIFYKTWIYVGHESEIAQPGDYKTTYIGRVPVILSRDEDGEVHVLINRCAHRGPTVCQHEYGNANFFRCEYHGWVYGNDGSLAGVSLRRGFGPGEIDDIMGGLDKAEMDSYRGLIFGRLMRGGPSLSEHLGLAKQYLDDWCDQSPSGEIIVTGGHWKHTYLGNWKLQVEGSNEGYHGAFLHKIGGLVAEQIRKTQGAGGAGAPRQPMRERAGIDLGNGHSVMAGGQGLGWSDQGLDQVSRGFPREFVEKLVASIGEERAAEILAGNSRRLVIFPNLAFSDNQIRVLRPIDVGLTEIKQDNIAWKDAGDAMNMDIVKGHNRFNGPAGYGSPDDIEMFARMYEGYRSSAVKSLNQWALFSRGQSFEVPGPNGERIAHTSTEVEQRAMYYAWSAAMKGESYITATEPTSGISSDQAAAEAVNAHNLHK